jgi:hypothetical protein
MKAYILKTDHPKSIEYAKTCSDSCQKNGIVWEYVEWHTDKMEAMKAWDSIGIPISNRNTFKPRNGKAQLATSGHAMIWKKIRDSGMPGIVLEHDAIMLHNIDIEIPDNMIVALGYKLENPEKYDHVAAGKPKEIIKTEDNGHEGAHAYVITSNTAHALLKELEDRGIPGAIDNTHFLKSREKHTKIPLRIMSPTPAIGWLRESTIWKKSSNRNYQFIQSFKEHYKK